MNHNLLSLGSIVLLSLGGCAHKPAASPAPPTAPAADPAPAPAADPAAAPADHRLAGAELDALGAPPQSPCHNYTAPADATPGGCAVRGPYPGIIAGQHGPDGTLSAALTACGADPDCIGVSTKWYGGQPWFAVTGAKTFATDTSSYGCTMVLACGK